jgi:hypothetical protein
MSRSFYEPYLKYIWKLVVDMADHQVVKPDDFVILLKDEIKRSGDCLQPLSKNIISKILSCGQHRWFTRDNRRNYVFHTHLLSLPRITEDLILDDDVRSKLPAKYQRAKNQRANILLEQNNLLV